MRRVLPNRRPCETFGFVSQGQVYSASVAFFDDGGLAEVFLTNGKAGSDSDAAARDSAVTCSIALQFGTPMDVIRRALLRDPQGAPSSPLGVALDMIDAWGT